MMTAIPNDSADRERILNDLGANLFVEAGAGAGKTTALVGRIVNLVMGGESLPGIAAITFTRKAAGELRDRVRQRLEEIAAGEGAFPDEQRALCERAAHEVDASAIETLDAFAARLVSERPLEAGLPPRFEMEDEVGALLAFEERWDAFRAGLTSDAAFRPTLLRALTLRLTLDALRDLARALTNHWDRLAAVRFPESPLAAVEAFALLGSLRSACADIDRCTDASDALYGHLQGVIEYAARLADASGEDLLDLLLDGPKLAAGRSGNQKNWKGIAPQEIRDALKAAEEERARLLAELRANVLPPLLNRAIDFARDHAEAGRREGRQGFHDILVRARNLLRDHADARAAAHARYRRILIDEFQDTDPLQIEIAVLIAGEWDGALPFAWERVPVPDGRLFFVGDPKQSIYRFRRADIDLYQSVQDRFQSQVVRLRTNFRSRPGIISWVNALFGPLMAGGEGQARYVDLEAFASDSGSPPPVYLLGGPSDANADAVRQAEAGDLAGAIQTVMAGGWRVRRRGAGQDRPVQYQDIAILLPARTSLAILERALEEADIPYRVEARSLIYGTEVVRDLLAVLRSLNDPTDEVALAAALRSPAFACPDDALYDYKAAGGRWDYRSPGAALPPEHPVMEAMAWLKATHDARWGLGVAGTVERVLRERRFYELALAHRRPRDHWKRLRLVQDQARDAAESGATSLGAFLRLIDQLSAAGGSTSDSILPDPDDDAVRILTIHAAKGLEFPVVLLAGLNGKGSANNPPVLWGPDGALEASCGTKEATFATDGYAAAHAREQAMERHEDVRLLYVAATRARDHLFVSLHHSEKGDCHARRICDGAGALTGLWGTFAAAPDGWTPPDRGSAAEPEGWMDLAAWEAERAARISAAAMLPAIAATAIARRAQEAEEDSSGEERPAWKRGRAGTALGRAVHAVLQSIDFGADDAEVRAAARHQATAEGIPDREPEVARLVRSALESPLVRETEAAGRRYWREAFVSTVIDGITVEGFLDLLIETPDGYVVVDFKTDSAAPEDAIARYRLQGATYALCVGTMLAKPVARCAFLFVQSGSEVDIPDLPAAIAEVRAQLAELRRACRSGRPALA